MLIIIFLISLIPAILIYFFLKNRSTNVEYKKVCKSALLRGMFLSALFVLLLSAILFIGEILLKFLNVSTEFCTIYHNFIVLAFSEEIMKYLVFKKTIQKYPHDYSEFKIISLMMIVSIGFELTESLLYAFQTNGMMMIVRGITLMHVGYGFIEGYFLSKAYNTKNKAYTFFGILLAFLLHGMYDLSLTDGFVTQDIFMFSALFLAALSIVIVIISIVYLKKRTKK